MFRMTSVENPKHKKRPDSERCAGKAMKSNWRVPATSLFVFCLSEGSTFPPREHVPIALSADRIMPQSPETAPSMCVGNRKPARKAASVLERLTWSGRTGFSTARQTASPRKYRELLDEHRPPELERRRQFSFGKQRSGARSARYRLCYRLFCI